MACCGPGTGKATDTDTEIDFSSMSVGKIKDFLRERSVDFTDCVEKPDLIKRAKDTVAKEKKEGKTSVGSTGSGSTSTSTSKIIFSRLGVGPLQCNMCIIGDPSTREAVLVDPGGDPEKIISLVKELKVKVTQILVTHGHFDHFLAADKVKKSLGAPIYLHKADLPLWKMLPMQCMLIGMQGVAAIADPDEFLEDDQALKVLDGKCIHTPGHSPGSCCFYFASSSLLCSGDTLFRGSIGRTDLMGGDPRLIQKSIQMKLYTLPSSVRVIPGHNEETTIGYEKEHNAIIRARA